MHRPIFHYNQDDEYHVMTPAEVCKACSNRDNLVPISFCAKAMEYVKREEIIEDKIEDWHNGAGLDQEMHEYLGWTQEQYANWINTCELPEE